MMWRRKRPGKIVIAALFLLGAAALLGGCHGKVQTSSFSAPEHFDTGKDYTITFWAKNDTNKTQVKILQDVDNQRVVLRPDSMVITIDVYLGGIRGLENCKSIRAAINNMRGRRYMAYDNYTEDKVAIAFEAFPNAADSCVSARFWVFGIDPSALSQDLRTLVTFFWMKGGRVFLPLDVTEAFVGLKEDDKHVVINMPDLDIDLNDYIKKGGMDVDVDDWNEEFHGITF